MARNWAPVHEMPHGVPEDFSLTLGAAVKAAPIDVKVEHVEKAEVADDQEKVESGSHEGKGSASILLESLPGGPVPS